MKLTWKLARRAAIPVVGVLLIGYAAVSISRPPNDIREPRLQPPTPADTSQPVVAAVGIVEPSSEIISIGPPQTGIVARVRVSPGQQVKRGAVLFELDARDALANASAARAAIGEAASSARVAAARAESARASLGIARVALANAEARYALFQSLSEPDAVSTDERDRADFAVRSARAEVQRAEAAAREASAFARSANDTTTRVSAQARFAQSQADTLIVRAPMAGEVLAVNIRPGELASSASDGLVSMGETRTLHVRVEIDEEDIGRLDRNGSAAATLRGAPQQRIPLTFVRFEPLTVPKRNLAGGAERVDTRVIQAVYAFERGSLPIFVGMRMDVFLTASTQAQGTLRGREAAP